MIPLETLRAIHAHLTATLEVASAPDRDLLKGFASGCGEVLDRIEDAGGAKSV